MPSYNSYNYNPYMQEFQNMRDRIDRTMQQYQQQQNQFQNQMVPQQPITQNFQLAPMQNASDLIAKVVVGIDDVKNTFVAQNGLFVNKEMNTLWTKNVSGDIKTYTLQEIIEVDPKDVEISNLKQELQNMRALISQRISEPIEDNKSEAPVKEKKTKKEE